MERANPTDYVGPSSSYPSLPPLQNLQQNLQQQQQHQQHQQSAPRSAALPAAYAGNYANSQPQQEQQGSSIAEPAPSGQYTAAESAPTGQYAVAEPTPTGSQFAESAPSGQYTAEPAPSGQHSAGYAAPSQYPAGVRHEHAVYTTQGPSATEYGIFHPNPARTTFPEHLRTASFPAPTGVNSTTQSPTYPGYPPQSPYQAHPPQSPYQSSPYQSPYQTPHVGYHGQEYGRPGTNWGYPPSGPMHGHIYSTSPTVPNSRQHQIYSFVPIPGAQQHKRPRRRYEEIERMYKCGYNGCEKAYGTLNHLNAHVTMQSHGIKRTPEEFKEIRKNWRERKRAQEKEQREREQREQRDREQRDRDHQGQPPPPFPSMM